jgi:hypothetical protein
MMAQQPAAALRKVRRWNLRTSSFTSDVQGAEIEVDGAFIGSTPGAAKVAPGVHKITVRHGSAVWSRDLMVPARRKRKRERDPEKVRFPGPRDGGGHGTSGGAGRARQYQYLCLRAWRVLSVFVDFRTGLVRLNFQQDSLCRTADVASQPSIVRARSGTDGISDMGSYFLLLFVSIGFLLAVWIIRDRGRHRLEAQSMRQHVSQLDPSAGYR